MIEKAKKLGVKLVNLQFTDILGILKSVIIPFEKLEGALEDGLWFDGSSINGFTRIHESDMYLEPDPETFALLPWVSKENPTARLICNVRTPEGKPFKSCPRHILQRNFENATNKGFIYNTGPELEFFLFKRDNNGTILREPHDKASYFDHSPMDLAIRVRREMMYALHGFGIEVEMGHHEVANGQHEIDFKYSTADKTADNAQTLRHTVKSVAHKHGLYATFMPKPIRGINGSGMHVHQSLFNDNGTNLFFDNNDPLKLSRTARNFIAGQMEHVKEISAVLCPNINSYKRLVPGYEAATYICWGQRNRSALIRVPRYTKGKEKAVRAELRCPDPTANPYLAFALMLNAGLAGIEKNLELPPEATDDVYEYSTEELEKNGIDTLPESLLEAIKLFKKSKLAKETLGKHAFEKYIEAKEKEWEDYKLHVTDWELEKYFETL